MPAEEIFPRNSTYLNSEGERDDGSQPFIAYLKVGPRTFVLYRRTEADIAIVTEFAKRFTSDLARHSPVIWREDACLFGGIGGGCTGSCENPQDSCKPVGGPFGYCACG